MSKKLLININILMSINEEKIVNKKHIRIINIANRYSIYKVLKILGEEYTPKKFIQRLHTFLEDEIAHIRIYTNDINYTYTIYDTPIFLNNPEEVMQDIIDYHIAKYPSKIIRKLMFFTPCGVLCLNKFLRLYLFSRIFKNYYATTDNSLNFTISYTIQQILGIFSEK